MLHRPLGDPPTIPLSVAVRDETVTAPREQLAQVLAEAPHSPIINPRPVRRRRPGTADSRRGCGRQVTAAGRTRPAGSPRSPRWSREPGPAVPAEAPAPCLSDVEMLRVQEVRGG